MTSFLLPAALASPGPRVIPCSANASRCWSQGELLHSDGAGCFAPLTRGPCPEGQWWLLRDAAGALGRCATLACPPDARSRECRRLMRLAAAACPRRPDGSAEAAVHMGPAGDFRCGQFPGRVRALHAVVRCRELTSVSRLTPSFAVNTNGRRCAQDDRGRCVEAVEDTQPSFVLQSED